MNYDAMSSSGAAASIMADEANDDHADDATWVS